MRKALYLLPRHPSWSETFLRQDLELLLGKGVPLVPAALRGSPGEIAGIQLRIAVPDAGAETASARRRLAGSLPKAWRVRLATWRLREELAALVRLAAESAVCHIHAAAGDLSGLLAVETARSLGISFSLDLHARDVHADKFGIARLAAAARFITVCNRCAAERLLVDNPALAPRLHLIHHGVRLADWPFADPMAWKASRPLKLLFAGRLVAKKGADCLPGLAAELRHRGIPVHVVIAGDGPLRPELEQLVARLGLTADFCFAGTVPREGICRFMQQVHALVMPAVIDADGDRDGIPNVAVEAMALGLPVVATSVGGLAEIMSPERAWPVTAAAPGPFAAVIQELLANPVETLGRAIAGRRLVEKHFDAETCIWKKADLFEEQAGLARQIPS
jgi:glycosyltransferase involved in cell wall biosynthesis